ncbi:MAG: YceI family protein [Gemmatimonadota bacterium]|nr:YceI family protein [Gemmatimonadota bacterium]
MRRFFDIAPLAALAALGVGLGAAGAGTRAQAQQPAAAAEAESWTVDQAHSAVNFSIRHFFTPVSGSFRSFDAQLAFDPVDPTNSEVSVTIDVVSVDTGNEKRDAHLRSADWFEAEKWPTMTFRSTSVRPVGDGKFVAEGDLTIKGVTQKVELPITLLGVQEIPPQMQEMLGGSKKVASFQATGDVDRREFGVGVGNWAQTAVVGADVSIEIAVEAHLR